MFRIYLLPALFILLVGCSTLKVQNDYDPAFDFATLRTFAVVYPQKEETVSLTQTRIAEAISQTMQNKGYVPVPRSEADFVIVFHTDVTQRQQVVTDYRMIGFFPYYGYSFGATMAIPVQHEYSYDEGKIIIDALNPDGNRIFWRAMASDRLRDFDTPEERISYINSVVAETLKPFPEGAKKP